MNDLEQKLAQPLTIRAFLTVIGVLFPLTWSAFVYMANTRSEGLRGKMEAADEGIVRDMTNTDAMINKRVDDLVSRSNSIDSRLNSWRNNLEGQH